MAPLKLFVLVVCVFGAANAGLLDGITSSVGQLTAGLSDAFTSATEPIAKQLLDIMIPRILLLDYKNVPTEEGYRFNYKTSDGSYREEVGMIMNPGTEQEELVVMGSYSYVDGDIETTTMYTADKNGYRPRVQIKNRGVSPKLLQNLSG